MRSACQRGFTAVELIVVIVVMGIVAALAAPSLVQWNSIDELGFRADLRAMLRHAQRLAVTQNRDVCVLLSPAAGAAQALYGAGNVCDATAPVADPTDGQPYTIQAPKGLALVAQQVYFTKGTGALWPTPAGNPSRQGLTIGSLPAPALWVHSETGFVDCNTGSALVC
ncbi:Tfp pilus assembly protein FimT/FimU [Aquabacterium sp.]|uniref:pilus assembly FimT family protein n=1 Tax=Aquabacterium sp. TaxID=1872578 RepID=UPI0035B0F764